MTGGSVPDVSAGGPPVTDAPVSCAPVSGTPVTDVLAAEWLKLRTLRSTAVLLAVLALTAAGACTLTAYAADVWDGMTPAQRTTMALAPLEAVVLPVVQLCLAVLGILTITTEYATGLIRVTFTAVPSRGRVLAAKALLVGSIALGAGGGCLLVTSYLTRALVGTRPIGFITDPATHTPALLLGYTLSVPMLALTGYGLGAALRSTTGAMIAVVALLHPVPMLAQALPGAWHERLGSLLPGALPGQLAGVGNDHSVYGAVLPPWGAAVVMALYVVVPLGVAAVRVVRDT